MNKLSTLIDMSNAINAELMAIIENDDINESKLNVEEQNIIDERLQARRIKRNLTRTIHREENRVQYNETLKLKMREYVKNNPQYKEKSRVLYYRKYYGVETKEEVDAIKLEKEKVKNRLIIDTHNKKIEERALKKSLKINK
jgi:hypothetical protein